MRRLKKVKETRRSGREKRGDTVIRGRGERKSRR